MPGPAGARRAARRALRRTAGGAMERYRLAVTERSRLLPAYLAVAGGADAALRARRTLTGGRHDDWPEAEPSTPSVTVTALSASGELSFVLAGAFAWRRTIAAVVLRRGSELVRLDGALVHADAGVVRVLAPLAPLSGRLEGWELLLVDADGEPLDLPTPPLAADGTELVGPYKTPPAAARTIAAADA